VNKIPRIGLTLLQLELIRSSRLRTKVFLLACWLFYEMQENYSGLYRCHRLFLPEQGTRMNTWTSFFVLLASCIILFNLRGLVQRTSEIGGAVNRSRVSFISNNSCFRLIFLFFPLLSSPPPSILLTVSFAAFAAKNIPHTTYLFPICISITSTFNIHFFTTSKSALHCALHPKLNIRKNSSKWSNLHHRTSYQIRNNYGGHTQPAPKRT